MRQPQRHHIALAALIAVALLSLACEGSTAGPAPTPTTTPLPTSTPIVLPHTTPPSVDAVTEAELCVRTPLPARFVPGSVPPWDPGETFAELVHDRVELYLDQGLDYEIGMQDYSATGDYLRYGERDNYEDNPRIKFDDQGVPIVDYDGTLGYNPVTIAQYALVLYGRMLAGEATEAQFLHIVDALVGFQRGDGGFPSLFPYTYYRTDEVLDTGWVGALAQGQALSVFRRAYAVSDDPRYLAAGDAALGFLLTAGADGGSRETLARLDASLDHFAWFEEYPTAQPQYTLNGFMFTLLGIYDWADLPEAPGHALADAYFQCGLATLEYILPYFDLNGMSTYDLGHLVEGGAPNVQVERHDIHIYLMHALHSLVPVSAFREWEANWIADVTG